MSEELDYTQDLNITIRNEQSETGSSILSAAIDKSGNFIMEGQDLGEAVEKLRGCFEYEHKLVVDEFLKDRMLLFLIQDRFTDAPALIEWLKAKDINYRFYKRRGD